jgi:hypothetical protein
MAKFIGRRVQVGFGKESSRAVAAAAQVTVPKTDYNIEDKANKARSSENFGNIAGFGDQSIVTGRFSEGTIEGDVNANSFALLLLSLFGNENVTTVYTSAYKHTLSIANTNQHQSLSIWCEDPIGDTLFKGCMVDSLEITVTPDEIVKYAATFKGRKGNDASWTPAPAADYKFVGRDFHMKVAANIAGLAAASEISVKEFKMMIQKNADYDWVLGTLEPEDVLNKQMTIQGSITLNYEDRTFRNYMLDGSVKAISVKLLNTRDTIATAGQAEFYIELPVVDFSEWESQRGNDEIASQTINFTALWDSANSRYIADCYIINMKAAF